MASELEVALIQMTSIDDLEVNFQFIESILNEIFEHPDDRSHSRAHPQLVCFPENCLYMRIQEGERIRGFEISDPIFKSLSALAKNHSTHLHLGSVPLIIENKLFNSSMLIGSDGGIRASYQKMHLFDVHIEGQKKICESDVFSYGEGAKLIHVDGWSVGQAICYDLRFAELFTQYAKEEVDLILLPAAFLVKTGRAHWEVLLRARAIENQCYIIASAQAGTHESKTGFKRESFGNSMIVDPWGEILCRFDENATGYKLAKLSKDRIESIRKQIPMRSHRRPFNI